MIKLEGAEGIRVIGKSLPVIERMIRKEGNRGNRTPLEYIGAILENSPEDAIELVAIFNQQPVEEIEHKSTFLIVGELFQIMNNEEVAAVFN